MIFPSHLSQFRQRKFYKRRALTGGPGYLVIIKQVLRVLLLLLLLLLQSPQSAEQLRLKAPHLSLSLGGATSTLGEDLLAADDLAKQREKREQKYKKKSNHKTSDRVAAGFGSEGDETPSWVAVQEVSHSEAGSDVSPLPVQVSAGRGRCLPSSDWSSSECKKTDDKLMT